MNANVTGDRSSLMQINFYDATVGTGFDTPIELSFYATAFDIDGGGDGTTLREYVVLDAPDAFAQEATGSSVNITETGVFPTGSIRGESNTPTVNQDNIDLENSDFAFTSYYVNSSSFNYRVGKVGNAQAERFYTLSFRDVTYDNPNRTYNTNPAICGVSLLEGSPQAGVSVELYDINNNLIDTAVTDENGEFIFDLGSNSSGTYFAREINGDDVISTSDTDGGPNFDQVQVEIDLNSANVQFDNILLDTDSDGIPDETDIDDDNDGILDIEEDICSNRAGTNGRLRYQFYNSVPVNNTVDNISEGRASAAGTGFASNFNVTTLQSSVTPGDGDTFSIRYLGRIEIATSETYTFFTNSDDGSKLFIDGVEIVYNDGDHGAEEASGTIALTPGPYDFEVLYYENGGGQTLTVSYETGTIAKQQIPFSVLADGIATFCDTDGDGIENKLDLDSDNDGIPDIIEAQSTLGYQAPSGTDADQDGLDDAFDNTPSGGNLGIGSQGIQVLNTDSVGNPDFLDLDSDEDGLFDIVESGSGLVDANSNGRTDGTVGNNGLDNSLESIDSYVDVNGDFDNTQADNFTDADEDVNTGGNVDFRDDDVNFLLINANDDFATHSEGASDNDLINVLDNDTLDGAVITPADVTITTISSDDPGITLDSNGGLDVTAAVNNGSFELVYRICETANPSNCDTATVTVTVSNTDRDNDGILDDVDIDDDNDGILDTDECTQNLPQFDVDISGISPDLADSSFNTSTGNVGDIAVYNNIGTYDGQPISLSLTVVANSAPAAMNVNLQSNGTGANADFPIGLDSAAGNTSVADPPVATIRMDFFNTNTSAPIVLPARLTFRDLDFIDGVNETVEFLKSDIYNYGLSATPTTDVFITESTQSLTGVSGNYISARTNSFDNGNVPADSQNLWWGIRTRAKSSFTFNLVKRPTGTGYRISRLTFDDRDSFCIADFDADGIINSYDLDSDNDGIPDNIEAQSTTGYIAPSGGVGANGLFASYENNDTASATGLTPTNTDGSLNPDFLDLDADDDSLFDIDESGSGLTDNDNNGQTDSTVGFNGLDNSLESNDSYASAKGDFDNTQEDNFDDTDGDVNFGGDVDYRDDLEANVPIVANDDSGNINEGEANNSLLNVLDNDTLGGIAVSAADVLITELTTAHPGISLNTTTGEVEVLGNVPSGVYTFDYRICQTANASNCNDATVTIIVGRDTDGDGIADNVDIDDDNDGILDVQENCVFDAYASGDWTSNDGVILGDNTGANPAYFSSIINPATAGSGVNTQLNETSVNLQNVDGNNLTEAISSNDYVEFDLTTSSLSNQIELTSFQIATYILNNGAGPVDEDNFSVGLSISSDNFVTSTTLGNYVDISKNGDEEVFSLIFDNIEYNLQRYNISPFQLSSNTVYKIRVYFYDDRGNDGTIRVDDFSFGVTDCTDSDSDNDGIINSLDLDSDNDGIPDNVEAQSTLGYTVPLGTDSDNDGLDNAYDDTPFGNSDGTGSNGLIPENTDDQDAPDYLDLDSDNDGIFDIVENGFITPDNNNDGRTDISVGDNGLSDNIDSPGNENSYEDVNGIINSPADDLLDEDNDVNQGGDVDYRDDLLIDAVDDNVTTSEDTPVVVDIYDNDSDIPTTGTLTTTQPANGTVVVTDPLITPNDPSDDVVTYTPDDNYNGSDSFTYNICDSNNVCDTATVNVTINSVNDLPTAVDDTATVVENSGATNIDVTDNDDFGGDGPSTGTITIPLLSNNGGTLTVDNNGTPNNPTDDEVIYTPAPDFNGIDTFDYTIEDADGNTSTATVTVNVQNDNDEDGIPDDVDIDDDNDGILDTVECDIRFDETTFSIVDGNSSTGLVLAPVDNFILDILSLDNAFNLNVNGVDLSTQEFEFQSNQPVTVEFADGDAYGEGGIPEVWNRSAANRETPLIRIVIDDTGNVGFFGSKVTNGPLFPLLLVNGNSFNTVTLNTSSTNTIIIDQSVVATTYATGSIYGSISDCDFDGDGIPNNLDLDSDNDGIPDNVEAQSTLGYEAPLGADSDNDGLDDRYDDTPIGNSDGTGSNGLALENTDGEDLPDFLDLDSDNDGLFDLVESGDNLIDSDSDGRTDANVGINGLDNNIDTSDDFQDVNGIINAPLNDLDNAEADNEVDYRESSPNAVDDTSTVNEDSGATNIDVTDNDDFGGDGPSTGTITLPSATSANGGTLTVDDNGTPNDPTDDEVVYTPAADFNGTDTFDYTIEDADGDTSTATVTVTVNSVNDVPNAVDDTTTVNEDSGATNIDVTDNDDFGGDGPSTGTITLPSATSANGGTLTVNNNGTPNDPTDDEVNYTPAADFNGVDTFVYTIEDADGDTSTATVTVAVSEVNDLPTALDDIATVVENSGATNIDVTNNDDFGGDGPNVGTITLPSATSANGGTLVVDDNGTPNDPTDDEVSYTPAPDFSGTDTFDYTIEDADGDTSTVTVTIAVESDTDGDGVPNSVDIDDDNDGILDVVEGNCDVDITPTSAPLTPVQGLDFVDQIFTTFDGYWASSVSSNNPINPNNTSELIAFEVNGSIYATGVNNNRLTDSNGNNLLDQLDSDNNGSFETNLIETTWSSFVVNNPISDGVRLEGSEVDGDPASANGPTLTSNAGPYNPYLTQGDRGLDLIYGIANIDDSYFFNVGAINSGVVGDGIPDLLLNQVAQINSNGANTASNTVYLLDASGNYLGDGVQISWDSVGILGKHVIDQYETSGRSSTNQVKNLRLSTIELSEFNLTPTEIENASIVQVLISPTADLAFFGVNDSTFLSNCNLASDLDNDGIPNYLDLDSDNDGIPDNVEGQPTVGYITPTYVDSDGDGLMDVYDSTPNSGADGSIGITPENTDETDLPDYLDLDSDNDGLFDLDESGDNLNDSDSDGRTDDPVGENGLDDNIDTPGNEDGYDDVNGIINTPSTDLDDTDGDVNNGGDVDYRDGEQFTVDMPTQTVLENDAFTSVAPTLENAPAGTITYGLSGVDAGLFTIDANTGVVSMIARDFENPDDANANNFYNLVITAMSSTGGMASDPFSVVVNNVCEDVDVVANKLRAPDPIGVANSSDTAELQVEVTDAAGAARAGVQVTITLETGTASFDTPSSGTTDANGFFSATVSSTVVGTPTFSATYASGTGAPDTEVEMGNPTQVRFLSSINDRDACGEVGIAVEMPHPSSVLEVFSEDKGLLIPSVALLSCSDTATIKNPATSLLVYNTNQSDSLDVGFVFYDGAEWRSICLERENLRQ